ncbi:expressed unknown protein [Seminavis robusta]|uniref:Tetratricopeptide repeat protein n=1 Tax=Seminavis robusta TaxID=568900 RepID=A0A9N8HG00_9STRA|nr:expressed unknown protein [Seminavis robusta]|eukprot:Sro549_g164610.1 n/a (238) ;mRNA; f:52443-53156
MEVLSRSLSERIRRNSFSGVTVKLVFQELENFLMFLVAEYTQDAEIAAVARENFSGLATRTHTDDELNEIVEMFGAILNGSDQELPPKAVAQIHSYVGLLRVQQRRYACSIQSYLKALWLQTSSTRDPLNIAITENRLGLSYGMSGNLPQAISLLEKSLEHYETAGLKPDHYVVDDAQAALSEFRSRYLQETLQKNKNSFRSSCTQALGARRLSHIQEELVSAAATEFQSERLYARW